MGRHLRRPPPTGSPGGLQPREISFLALRWGKTDHSPLCARKRGGALVCPSLFLPSQAFARPLAKSREFFQGKPARVERQRRGDRVGGPYAQGAVVGTSLLGRLSGRPDPASQWVTGKISGWKISRGGGFFFPLWPRPLPVRRLGSLALRGGRETWRGCRRSLCARASPSV